MSAEPWEGEKRAVQAGSGAKPGVGGEVRVDVCVCTYRRESLSATLASLEAQRLPAGVRARVIVADNDKAPSAEGRVRAAAAGMRLPVLYRHAPARNISIARNACLDAADGDWAAFLDDDGVADPDWLARLLAAAAAEAADVVFGPALAVYPPGAPRWMRENDIHSSRPARRRGVVETGHTGNVLLRRGDGPAARERFSLGFGRTGGEDVEYFHRLHRMGARMTIAEDALVREPVEPGRLSVRWALRRRMVQGRCYGAVMGGSVLTRAGRAAGAGAKMLYCGLRAAPAAADRSGLMRWTARAVFHAGVCAGCFAPPRLEVYGRE